MKYFVTLGDAEYEVELTDQGVERKGRLLPVELATVPGSVLRHLRIGDRGYRVTARRVETGWEVEYRGQAVRVRVEDARARSIRELTGLRSRDRGPRELRAPMPGLIVRITVEQGAVVPEGAGLVVMEAMKMQNELKAPAPGVVTEVAVRPGQTVDRDALLLRLEPETNEG